MLWCGVSYAANGPSVSKALTFRIRVLFCIVLVYVALDAVAAELHTFSIENMFEKFAIIGFLLHGLCLLK